MILENNSYEYKIQEILKKLNINLNLKTFLPLNDFSAKFSQFLIQVNKILKQFNQESIIELALLNIENEIDKNSIQKELNTLFPVLKLESVENSIDLQTI